MAQRHIGEGHDHVVGGNNAPCNTADHIIPGNAEENDPGHDDWDEHPPLIDGTHLEQDEGGEEPTDQGAEQGQGPLNSEDRPNERHGNASRHGGWRRAHDDNQRRASLASRNNIGDQQPDDNDHHHQRRPDDGGQHPTIDAAPVDVTDSACIGY